MLEIRRIKKPQPEVCTEQRGSLKTKISPGQGPKVPLIMWGMGLKTVNLLKKWAQTSQTQPPTALLEELQNRMSTTRHTLEVSVWVTCVLTLRRSQKLCLARVYQVTSPPLLPCHPPPPLLLIICSHISMDRVSPSIWQRFQEKIWTNSDREKTKNSNQ